MAMILKYWAKKRCLIAPEMISTFGLYMMIAYLLQQTSPPILPTIERLQQLASQQPDKKPIRVHNYSFEFCDDEKLLGKSTNTETTPELLVKFFEWVLWSLIVDYKPEPLISFLKSISKN